MLEFFCIALNLCEDLVLYLWGALCEEACSSTTPMPTLSTLDQQLLLDYGLPLQLGKPCARNWCWFMLRGLQGYTTSFLPTATARTQTRAGQALAREGPASLAPVCQTV
jgi:hypothetical protein